MTYSRSSSSSNREEDRFRDIGTAAAAMIALFFVLLSVFVYISRLDLTEMAKRSDPAAASAIAGDPLRAASSEDGLESEDSLEGAPAAEGDTEALAGVVADDTNSDVTNSDVDVDRAGASTIGPDAMRSDEAADAAAMRQKLGEFGYQVRFPEGWRAASVDDLAPPMSAADHDLVLQAPASGARMAVSSWDAADLVPLVLWAPTVAEGMRPVDGRWATNAVLAGEPAMILWAQESPISPARYAAFVGHGSRYYRLAYSAADGGDALDEFSALLNSLRWSDAAQADDAGDRLPPMPLPRPRYHPSERLFESVAPSN